MRYFYKEKNSKWSWVNTDESSVWFFTGSHFKYPSGTKLKISFDELIKDKDWVEEKILKNSTWLLRDKWRGIYPDKITLEKEKEGSFEYNDGENISLFSLLSFYKKNLKEKYYGEKINSNNKRNKRSNEGQNAH